MFFVAAMTLPAVFALALKVPTPDSRATVPDVFACDVGIVGAGPAGLVLAHALSNRGLKVRVYERRAALEPVGAVIFLWPFGLSSLRAINSTLADKLREAGTVVERLRVNHLSINMIGAEAAVGEPYLAVRYWDMVCAMLSGLPDDAIVLDHRLQSFEHLDEGGVRLHFEGTAPSQAVRYLVDAGGIHSATRKQLRGDAPIQHLTATYAVAQGDGASAGELALSLAGGAGVLTASLQNGDVWRTQSLPSRQQPESTSVVSSEDTVDGLMPRLADTIKIKIGELPLSFTWGERDVTLLGDAAHAQTPALGLGVSTAFGDVLELATCIDASPAGLTRATLRGYETNRKHLCFLLQLASRSCYLAQKNFARFARFAPAASLVRGH